MNLESKIAIVTGASSGVGAATSKALIHKNAIVYGLARNKEKLKTLQQSLGENFHPIVLDVCNEEQIQQWVSATFNDNYLPSILINNAGASQFATIDKLSHAQWHQMVNVNLNAVHFMTSALVAFMKNDEESSHIINIGSILGKTSSSEKSAYSATKFAIQGYSEALFKELRAYNIKVTCLNPGSINTHFFESSGIVPNNKMLQAEEIANIITFLLETPDNVLIDELTVRPLRP